MGKEVLSRMAAGNGHGEESAYFDGWKAYEDNPFHPLNNPQGVIQMGLAENQLCFDLVKEWVMKHPKASICTVEGVDAFKDTAIFQDYHGFPHFRNAVAKFMEKVRGNRVTFDPDRIVMSGGATGAHELMVFCLANPGEAFLVPTPYYPGFDRDLRWRTRVQLLPIECDSTNNFKLTREALEKAYKKAEQQNIIVKGVLVTNPSNPLGTVLDRETLNNILSFTTQKNIHLVCDEIYGATVFGYPNFVSIAEILLDQNHNPDLIHIVYSLSKDLGFPGFRVGIVYSYNDDVVNCARKMSSFGLVSTQTQTLIGSMLSDEEFVDKFLAESRKRLENRHNLFTKGLSQFGIQCLKSNAGLFVWMNLRQLIEDNPTEDGELKLWRVIINEVKINVSPGCSFHCKEAGWFRVCIANMDDETMQVSLKRIRNFAAQKMENNVVKSSKRKCWHQNNLQLRLSNRRMDDLMGVSQLVSPHSPLPQSPLVRALN
ncbi:1-aminocyclopropane-1-carboxylate synthase-like [Amaranthus tricolor]|uniref:1-aminocyclopropane-1-carboxylate synthase-like n=1 Tax=Amaranthus tricolor TaxID=29722 RepID=UPI002591068C|nr:1-aminocyclopropane-1-carboxylate synthase-like [Amaranthus tricolor]